MRSLVKSRIFLLLAFVAVAFVVNAQEGVSKVGSLNIVKEVKPPILSVVQGSVQFSDNNGNNAIDAGEVCNVMFDIKNSGIGDAQGCIAKVELRGSTSGITTEQKRLPQIAVGATQRVVIPIRANMLTTDGEVTLTISIKEPMGFDIAPFDLAVHTKAFDAPLVKVADYALSSAGSLQKNTPFDLQVAVQNMRTGRAEQVTVDVEIPQGVYLLSGNQKTQYGSLDGGKAQMLTYKIIVPTNYASSTIPIQIRLKEKYGKYAENKTIELPLNQEMAKHTIVVNENVVEQNKTDFTKVSIGSDVDKNIPQSKTINDNTYVLIIANENYKSQEVADVPYALRDGEVFRQYCKQTLGINNDKHIHFIKNASFSDFLDQIDWLKNALALGNTEKAIVYYSGHGQHDGNPDDKSRKAYLLPVENNGQNMRTAYSVDELYTELGKTNKPVTVFLDACFSGARRDGDMITQGKGIKVMAPANYPKGKTLVFSAATGNQTAGFYKQQQHGMFTYWLLKIMQETQGDVSYETLWTDLYERVRQSSFDENNQNQTPTTMYGGNNDDWKTWTLK